MNEDEFSQWWAWRQEQLRQAKLRLKRKKHDQFVREFARISLAIDQECFKRGEHNRRALEQRGLVANAARARMSVTRPARPATGGLVRALGLQDKVSYRSLHFDRSAMSNDRTIRLSVSSDAPYDRSFGVEILRPPFQRRFV